MKILIDTHTHSIASGHAYSTIDELAKGSAMKELYGFVLSDHGPSLPGTTQKYHFSNLKVVPKSINGTRFYTGIEANILDQEGSLDLAGKSLAKLDFVMAGLHELSYDPGSLSANTEAMIAAIANPFTDAISHPGNPAFPIDKKAVVKAAAAYGKALEINNSSFRVRPGSEINCLEIARYCGELGVLVVIGSDAHYWLDVGSFDDAINLAKKAGIKEEQVINASVERFEIFINKRKAARIEAAL